MLLSALFLAVTAILDCQAENSLTDLAKANDKFTGELYKHIADSQKGNIVYSGLSANLILSLLTNGAKGETQTELINGLHLLKNEAQRNEGFRQLTSSLSTNTPNLKILSANKIYPADGFPVIETFKKIAYNDYRSDVQNLNFKNGEEAASIINKWVGENTNDKIQNLLSSDMLDGDTKLVLVNALYFSGKWLEPFPPAGKQKFFTSETESKELDFLQADTVASYRRCGYYKAKFLELPFQGGNISMTFILPENRTGLKNLENNLEDVIAPHDMKTGVVSISIPKFRVESKINLVPELKKLGVSKIFSQGADLSGLSPQPNLTVDLVIQKAFLDVSESGVEAAAASTVAITPLMQPENDFTFLADHPFLYHIRDKRTGAVLFVGRFQG